MAKKIPEAAAVLELVWMASPGFMPEVWLGPGHQDDTATPETANPDVIVTVILCAIISLIFAVNY